ncbi:MAG TPA: alpha/beta fold hydrolase [Blastocatellia bacterium]|nr:alpha/beta fold hydrolase [Blastocatellia bacterium]
MNRIEVEKDEPQEAQPAEPLSAAERQKKWLRRAGLIGLGAAGSLGLAIGAACYPLSGLLVRPRLKRLSQLKSPHLRHLLSRRKIDFEDITIPSFDGTRLHGWWMPSGVDAPTVVVLHGVKKNRTDVLRAALALRQAGLNVLIFDGRGHGNSEGRYVTYGFYERRDVETAIEWLVAEKKIDRNCVGLAGESMGAAIALQVAARNEWIRAVWADSPFASLRRVSEEFLRRVTHLPDAVLNPVIWTTMQFANYRGNFDVKAVDPLSLAAGIKCPVYLVHGTADQLIATAHSQNIFDALGGDKEMWFVEGARHARSVRHAKREYSERLVSFFTRKLKSNAPGATHQIEGNRDSSHSSVSPSGSM